MAVYWECDPSTWMTREDSTFTVFYDNVFYRILGDSIRVYDHTGKFSIYWASEFADEDRPQRHAAGFRKSDTHCGVWSSAFADSIKPLIYKGLVTGNHLGTPSGIFYLLPEWAPIAWLRQDGTVVPIDLLDLWRRDGPQPPEGTLTLSSNGYKGYYLPLNTTEEVESGSSLIGSRAFTSSLWPYIVDATCMGDECPEWDDPICPAPPMKVEEEEETIVAVRSSGSGGGTGGGSSSGSGANSDGGANSNDEDAECSSSPTVTEGPAPDLVVLGPNVSDSIPETGGTFWLIGTVHNQGDGRSAATTVRYYRSTNSTITTSDVLEGTDAVGEKDHLQNYAATIRLTAPATAGTYYYGACVDAVAGESDTCNNCSSGVQVTVR